MKPARQAARGRVRGVVDRIEAGVAVIEIDGFGAVELPERLLPAGCREGTVVELRAEIDDPGTGALKKKITDLQQELEQG